MGLGVSYHSKSRATTDGCCCGLGRAVCMLFLDSSAGALMVCLLGGLDQLSRACIGLGCYILLRIPWFV